MVGRKNVPEIHQIKQIDYLRAECKILPNGIPVYYINGEGLEVVKIDFVFDAGTWQQEDRFVASFTASMLQEGSLNYSSSSIAELFDFYGAYIQIVADQNYATVSVICLCKYLSEILTITEDIIKRPVFPQKELDILLSRQKQKFRLENEKVKVLCQKRFSSILFGSDHPYAMNNQIEHLNAITREKLSAFFREWYHADNCRIFVAGNVNEAACSFIEKYFGGNDWKAGAVSNTVYRNIIPEVEKEHIINKKGALQTAIRMGRLWINKTHPDYCPLSVLITVFGGYFGSRLMMNIREEKGYTYGIGAYVVNLKYAAYLTVASEVDNGYVEATKTEIRKEMKRLQDELIPEEELEAVRSYLLGEFLRDFDGSFALISSFKAINDFYLDYAFYDHYLQVVNTITAEKLQQLAQEYLNPEDMFTVQVGA